MNHRNPISHNIGWKVLSVLLAVLTWLTIETEFQRKEKSAEELRQNPLTPPDQKRVFSAVPLVLLTSVSNTNHYKVTPDSTEVIVGGDRDALTLLQSRQIQAFVDVSDAQDEKQFLRPILVRVPAGFNVVTNDPRNASVERITTAR